MDEEFGGMQEGIDETFTVSSRAVDRELRDSIKALKESIEAERMILQSLLHNTRSGSPINLRD